MRNCGGKKLDKSCSAAYNKKQLGTELPFLGSSLHKTARSAYGDARKRRHLTVGNRTIRRTGIGKEA